MPRVGNICGYQALAPRPADFSMVKFCSSQRNFNFGMKEMREAVFFPLNSQNTLIEISPKTQISQSLS